MRRLGISLLLVVVMAIIGAGWAIDRLFIALNSSEQSLEIVRAVGTQLALQLDDNGQGLQFDDEIPEGYELALMEKDDLSLPPSLQVILDTESALTLESEQGVSTYFLLPETGRILSVSLPEPFDTRLRLLLTLLFYASIASLILLWLYPLVRRIQRLALAAKRFGEGKLEQRISTRRRSQLYDIETEFNRMAQRIQDLVEDNKLLTGAVSHDLRTPLARLRFGVDALSEQVHVPMQQDYLSRISVDLTAMEELVEVLLEFARLNQRLTELPLQTVSLEDQLNECVEGLNPAGQTAIGVNVLAKQTLFKGEPRFLKMLINNLLNNALKFCSNAVTVTVTSNASELILCVEDDGPGFQDDDPERLLRPFERGMASRKKEGYTGHGMGLAIVHRIAVWHNAGVELGSSPSLGGARICIAFHQQC